MTTAGDLFPDEFQPTRVGGRPLPPADFLRANGWKQAFYPGPAPRTRGAGVDASPAHARRAGHVRDGTRPRRIPGAKEAAVRLAEFEAGFEAVQRTATTRRRRSLPKLRLLALPKDLAA